MIDLSGGVRFVWTKGVDKKCLKYVAVDIKIVSYALDWLSSFVMQMMLILTSIIHATYAYIVSFVMKLL